MSDRLYNFVLFLVAVGAALGLGQLAYVSAVAAGIAVAVLFVVACLVLGPFDPRA